MMSQTATEDTQPDTSKQQRIRRELAALLDKRREEIATIWAKLVHALPDSHYRALSLEELLASTRRGLGAMVEALGTGSYAALEAYLTDVSLTRLEIGFDIGEVTEALLLCKDVALPVIRRAYPPDSTATWESIAQLNACLRWIVGCFNELYATETNRLLQEQQARTAMILDMVQTASATLELDEVLRRVAAGVATATGVDHCGLFLVDDRQGFVIPRLEITVPPVLVAGSKLGMPSPRQPQPIAELSAFFRQVVAQKEPLACYDVQTDPLFDPEAVPRRFGFRSVLAVPFVAKGRVVAVAYALTFDDCRVFTEEQIRLVGGLANSAALAIENAWLHQRVKQQAIVEERNRLAQEMHDDLSQVLGTINWRAATVDRLLSSGQIDQAQASLHELKNIAKQGYADVREAIFTLRSAASLKSEFLPAMEQYLAEVRTYHGLDVELVVDTPSFPWFPVEVRLQIIRIIQEALTNVQKHAGASRIQLVFRQDGDRIQISVEDDGRGFDPAQVEEEKHRFGLSIMRERAASVGAALAIDSCPGKGTRVVLRLPLQAGD